MPLPRYLGSGGTLISIWGETKRMGERFEQSVTKNASADLGRSGHSHFVMLISL